MSETVDRDLSTEPNEAVSSLLDAARALADDLEHELVAELPDACERIRAGVVRPLAEALGSTGQATETSASAKDVAAANRLRGLARAATAARAMPHPPPALLEATAALQDMACTVAAAVGAEELESFLAELAALQAGVPSGIQAMANGPYLVTNANDVHDHLGRPLPVRPQLALCRCGASRRKPLCDGTHAAIGFTSAKDPNRVPDRRDSYPGQEITVLDNRGICAHSGFCTDRVPSVFHAGAEPFVTPSGGRMDEIIRAARNCPSGALSYAIDGQEARNQVDQSNRAPAIEVSKDGPYRITGGMPLVNGDGEPEQRVAGASLEHYSLCRCGQSKNKPFCSGQHWAVNFTDPVPNEDPNLFEWAGGMPALLRATRIFYQRYVPQDPLLSPLFGNMATNHPERVALWLAEVFGGPKNYTKQYGGYSRMISQHVGKRLTKEQRARWAALMFQSITDAGLPDDAEWRAAFIAYIEWGTRIAFENSQAEAHPPEGMPVPRWWWVCDATPSGRVSALAPREDEPAPPSLPGPGEPVTYAAHIKPLFRMRDRRSMRFAFDLWSYSDVAEHADEILLRLRAGTMPCDGAWPAEKLDVLARWVDAGKPE